MNRFRLVICAAIVAFVSATLVTAAEGRLVEHRVPGPALEGNLAGIANERVVEIYLPPSYGSDPDRRYPSLYVLHGIFDSNTNWTRPWNQDHPGFDTIQAAMDAGIDAGILQEMIVVVPDSDKVCHYTDSPVRGDWTRFIAEDLVAYVDGHYRTIPRAGSRGVTGHSMGGHGAIKLAMLHPDVFSVAYGLNPSLLGWGGDVTPDNPAFEKLAAIETLDDIRGAHFYVQAIVMISQCFAPNPKSPLLADLPFAEGGNGMAPSQPGYDAWTASMPIYRVEDYADNLRGLRGLRFDSGYDDEFTHIPVTSKRFSEVLDEHDVAHTFEMYNGDHRNRLWGRRGRVYTEVLPYFSDLLTADGD